MWRRWHTRTLDYRHDGWLVLTSLPCLPLHAACIVVFALYLRTQALLPRMKRGASASALISARNEYRRFRGAQAARTRTRARSSRERATSAGVALR